MNKPVIISLLLLSVAVSLFLCIHMTNFKYSIAQSSQQESIWSVRSIDTMKYSRDSARDKENDTSFNDVIDLQVSRIASAGASHIAIATPYDEEFVPFLKRWVETARKYKLNVWFRGNFSGWEQWYDYKSITRLDHLDKTGKFITTHPDLFENGDIFTACPECENGGPGDPRVTGDIAGHRQFLIDEARVSKDAFKTIGKRVDVRFNSMNYDVAMVTMDRDTTTTLGGVVAIDHYVSDPEQMISDISVLREYSGGQIVLSELGAPIPDIHGQMSEDSQADWIRRTLDLLVLHKSVIGVNYWLGFGGTTAIWNEAGVPRRGAQVLTSFFTRLTK